jgi:hypothetical protein
MGNGNCGCNVKVFIPGPPGPPLISVGSYLVPTLIDSGTIAAPVARWQRDFIQAAIAPLNQPVISNPIDNGSWMLGLQVVGTNTITLNDASNIKLRYEWVGQADSILWLLWDGNSRWVESGRNEI